jgi:hypothetical protein
MSRLVRAGCRRSACKEKAGLHLAFKPRESAVGGVWLRARSRAAAHGIEFPHQRWIAPPGMGRSDFFKPVIAPEAARVAKCGYSAFGADPSSREHENPVGCADVEHNGEISDGEN